MSDVDELIERLRSDAATQDYVAAMGGMTVVDVNKEDLVRVLDEVSDCRKGRDALRKALEKLAADRYLHPDAWPEELKALIT